MIGALICKHHSDTELPFVKWEDNLRFVSSWLVSFLFFITLNTSLVTRINRWSLIYGDHFISTLCALPEGIRFTYCLIDGQLNSFNPNAVHASFIIMVN